MVFTYGFLFEVDVSAVLFMERNLNRPIDPAPVILQLLAYQALQLFASVKSNLPKSLDSNFGTQE
jgi:hypothetical protein